MKRVLLLVLFVPVLLGWVGSIGPKGHLESTTVYDGIIYPSTTTSITNLPGTAHGGGDDQADADTKGIVYSLYVWWDIDKDGTADAGDEPIGATSLTAGISDSVLTVPVASTATFRPEGHVTIGDELIVYSSKTATTLVCAAGSRGFNETTAASHSDGDAVTAVAAWDATGNGLGGDSYTCDGSPFNAIGWDVSAPGEDDGTEGDLFQGDGYVDAPSGHQYLAKIRIIDGSGNTNTEVEGSDVFATFGTASYTDADGDAAQGLEDNEVLSYTINKKPRRRFGRR